jgi:hypothetical protein
MAHFYIVVISACVGYVAKHFHLPFGVAAAVVLAVTTFAFLVARLVEDDRK